MEPDSRKGEETEVVEIEIDSTLDLHNFSPKDLKTLIPDYILECKKKSILELRIIHGKGKGNLRRSVHALLTRNPHVKSFEQAELQYGGWGATIVYLL